MKNNHDPDAMIGQRRLKQVQKRAAMSRGSREGVSGGSANPVLLLEEARKWLEQFYFETGGMRSRSSQVFNSRMFIGLIYRTWF